MSDLIGLSEIAKELDLSYPTVYRYCRDMKDKELKGYIVVKKKGKRNIYLAKPSTIAKLKQILGYEEGKDEEKD